MTETGSPARTYWVDVEDFFQYFAANPRPSGIQRLVFETLGVLADRARLSPGAPRIALARHTADASLLREVPFDSLAAALRAGPRAAPEPRRPTATASRPRRAMVRLSQGLPPAIGEPLLRAGVLQLAALRHARRLIASLARPAAAGGATPATAPVARRAAAAFPARPGDVLLILGAPWGHADYGALLRRARARYQMTAALLVYDLIPLRRPEWCAADLVRDFSAWLAATLPQCATVMAISRATAADVEAYAREIGLTLAGPVTPIPIGASFGPASAAPHAGAAAPRGLPAPGGYALFVSTLEARKNHALLFRVWRRLLADLPRERVPTLVFAGRVGWLVEDLMRQLDNAGWLDGKIRLLRDPTDAELAALYRGCQFTVFPSLFEGWGLPVSESLAHGRPCLSSHATSLPEAGGDLARYFDPENVDDAYRAVRAIIEDPAGLLAWRDRVAREFRPVAWERTADAILAACRADRVAPPAADALEAAR